MGKYRISNNDDGLYLHHPHACNVHNIKSGKPYGFYGFSQISRPTFEGKIRFYPSPRGWVATVYETKGRITFFVQLNEQRAAWQRIEWAMDFDKNWNDAEVQKAIDNFLDVAERQEQEQR